MKRDRWIIGVAIVLLFLLARIYLDAPAIEFRTLTEASTSIQAAGYHCTSDRADGRIQSGFLVSTEKLPAGEANSLFKVGKLGPEWKGKVWVSFNGRVGDLASLPDDGGQRIWGDVMAFGDNELLKQLELALQRQFTRDTM